MKRDYLGRTVNVHIGLMASEISEAVKALSFFGGHCACGKGAMCREHARVVRRLTNVEWRLREVTKLFERNETVEEADLPVESVSP